MILRRVVKMKITTMRMRMMGEPPATNFLGLQHAAASGPCCLWMPGVPGMDFSLFFLELLATDRVTGRR